MERDVEDYCGEVGYAWINSSLSGRITGGDGLS